MLEFTSTGYIEVRLAGVLVSRHRAEREAVESITRHCEGKPAADYEIIYPRVQVRYSPPAGSAPATGSIDCPVAEFPLTGLASFVKAAMP